MADRSTAMPAIFVGHGNPMYAIEPNRYADAWRALGETIGKPKAVLAVSAHWYVDKTAVTANEKPRTIHDFGGFPRALYEVEYPAPGDPALASRVAELLAPATPVELDHRWGLDHGTWAVLRHVFPDADVPVVQLSIDETKTPREHYELARRLNALRDEGVLVFASGNVVHNLEVFAYHGPSPKPYDWAVRFERTVRERIESGDDLSLVDYERLGEDALLSAPTPDHYLPLLYALAAHRPDDRVSFPTAGIEGGSVSMLSIAFDEG